MEEEENQREMKRLKEKEKKEANEALMQELSEWENEIFTKSVLKELRSIWEVCIGMGGGGQNNKDSHSSAFRL